VSKESKLLSGSKVDGAYFLAATTIDARANSISTSNYIILDTDENDLLKYTNVSLLKLIKFWCLSFRAI
jgi:hypothetical protein